MSDTDHLFARLLETPYDHAALLAIQRALRDDAPSFARVLEQAAEHCDDEVLGAHWLTEAALMLRDTGAQAGHAVELLERALRLDPKNQRIAAELDDARAVADAERMTDPDGFEQRFASELREGIGADVLDYLESVADFLDDEDDKVPHAALVQALETRAAELRHSLHARASLLRRAAAVAFRELGDVDTAYDCFVESILSTVEGDARSAAEQLARKRSSEARFDAVQAMPSVRVGADAGRETSDTVPAPPPTTAPTAAGIPDTVRADPRQSMPPSVPTAPDTLHATPPDTIRSEPLILLEQSSDLPPAPESSIILRDSIADDVPVPPTIPPVPGAPPPEPLVERLFETLHCARFIESVDEAAASALEAAVRIIGATKGIVQRYDFAAREFVVVRAYGPRAGAVANLRTDERDELIQQVMAAREALFLPAVVDDPRISRGRWAYLEPTSCLLCAPAHLDGRYLGMIEIADPVGRAAFTDEERLALTYVGDVLAELISDRDRDAEEISA